MDTTISIACVGAFAWTATGFAFVYRHLHMSKENAGLCALATTLGPLSWLVSWMGERFR